MNGESSVQVELSSSSFWSALETSLEFHIIQASITNPAQNLKEEEEIFEKVERGRLGNTARFWVNDKCLVKGRARTSKYGWYREEEALRLGIPVYERTTGGGVVYHDLGNLNWSFFVRIPGRLLSPERVFREGSAFVVVALKKIGIDAYFAPPNRIEVSGYKVSGMAARSTINTLLVHGTLLLNSDLNMLNRLCIPPEGCPPVRNLNEWAKFDIEQFVESVRSEMVHSGFKPV
jgi:lipoate-protein ligase A